MDDLISLLQKLSEASGPPGSEGDIGAVVKEALTPFADEVTQDKFGNVIAHLRGTQTCEPRKKILLAAHMDEVALIITRIDEGGYLRFAELGGLDPRILLGAEVTVHGRKPLHGFVGTKAPHLQTKEESSRVMDFEELFIDVALPSEEVEKQVRPGDAATLIGSFTPLQNSLVSGKALDDRAGVAAMIQALKLLKRDSPSWDIYAVATVQEEISGLGALASTWSSVPDIAVILETTYGTAPDVSEREGFDLGQGPALGMGMTVHHGVTRKLKGAAQKTGVSYQIEAGLYPGGKDAVVIQLAKEGIPTGVLSIPVRNMHTPVEVASLEDIVSTSRLMAAFAADLKEWP